MKMLGAPPAARRVAVRAFGAVLGLLSVAADAVDLPLGVPDLDASIVTDLRYNIGVRASGREPAIGLNSSYDQGDYRFDKGDVVTNRLDATPQLQVRYSTGGSLVPSLGLRVSGNLFKDFAYDHDHTACRPGTAPVGLPVGFLGPTFPGLPLEGDRLSYCDPALSDYVDAEYDHKARRSAFEHAELLDAFLFMDMNLGSVPVNVKAGRYALFWGESLFNPFLGVSAGMGAIDLNKALTIPGANAQDLFRPVNQISATATLSPALSLGFQYFLPWNGWDKVRAPEGGTFLSLSDAFIYGPEQFYVATLPFIGPYSLLRTRDVKQSNHGNFGLQAKVNASAPFSATYGFYYRQFDEALPWVNPRPATPETQPVFFAHAAEFFQLLGISDPSSLPPLPGEYRLVFPRQTRLMGLSLSTQQLGISFGADFAYSPNRALNSQLFATDDSGRRARGKTLSGVVNALYLTPPVSVFGLKLWDSAQFITEFNWSHLIKVTRGEQFYKGVDTDACRADAATFGAIDIKGGTVDSCSRRTNVGVSFLFQPTWYQVHPGVDLNGTFVIQDGLWHNSPINIGGNEGQVTGSVGTGATIYNVWNVALAYNFYNVQHRTGRNLDGERVDTSVNFLGDIRDRDWVSLSVKRSF